MPRKKAVQQIVQSVADSTSLPPETSVIPEVATEAVEHTHQPIDLPPIEPSPEVKADDVKEGEKKWEKRKNPFSFDGYQWPDGFKINILIREWEKGDEKPTRLLIRFGDGTAKDKPMALDKIKPVLEEYGYRWSQEDAAWSRWMKSNKEQAGRIHNARLHNEAQDLLQTVVSLEESVRGPVPGRERGQEQAIPL